jgi:iron complex transport system substrate-binding protein
MSLFTGLITRLNWRSGYYLILLLMLLLFSSAACSQKSQPPTSFSSSAKLQTGEFRTVKHLKGTTKVPLNPQRIIALDNIALDSVLALKEKPIAALYNENTGDLPIHLRDRVAGIEPLSPSQQNLEVITALKPDLILGGKNVEPVYNLLSQIAPTLLLVQGGDSNWKNVLKLTATALGKPEKAEQLLQDYQQRLDQLKRELGPQADDLKISVVRVFPGRIRLYQKGSFVGEILEDAGLSRPASQQNEQLWQEISKERIKDADGDVIFVWALGDRADNALEKLKSDPLWSQLKAVRENRIYEVPGHWIGSGPLAANAVIDDLFRYLLNNGTKSPKSTNSQE